MNEAAKLLQNLVYHSGYFKATIKEGIAALNPYAKDLEAVHIRIDYPDPSTWRKKKYRHISREEICSRLDEWIFKHLVNQNEYAGRKYRAVLTSGFGSNFDLDKRLYREIYKKGLYWK